MRLPRNWLERDPRESNKDHKSELVIRCSCGESNICELGMGIIRNLVDHGESVIDNSPELLKVITVDYRP